ncbi:MAG TPA: VacB/RNase II family 3'-5' exoribonuclease [Thermoanaerobaculia bacterium]|nr:VacB/RNase II family 3'-5' exoribonuclease [Thermoanaerobaculia bacterium]
MSIEEQAASVMARLRHAGQRGLPESELGGTGTDEGDVAAALAGLRTEGRAVLWARRWYAVDDVRWWPGTFTRRGRAGGVVRRATPAPEAGRRHGARNPARGPDEVFVPERDRGGARQGDFVLVRPGKSAPGRAARKGELPLAVVVAVLRRVHRRMVGELVRDEGSRRKLVVRPWDADQWFDAGDVRVEGARDLAPGTWVVLELGENRRDGSIPARVTEVLGTLEEPGTDIAVVLRHFEIVESFPDDVLAEAAKLPPEPGPKDWAGRLDLRDRLAVTIDGEHARDFDDAIEVRRTRGGFLARVHIADVAHYVRVGSAIDREASRRGTSVYFPERAVHMLPGALSEQLCSLKPGVDRLALTVELRFDQDGRRTSSKFSRSVIRSRARLTYRQVEDYLQGTAGAPRLPDEVARLLDAARLLASRLLDWRQDRGAIDFLLPEVELRIDEMGAIVHIEQAERLESQRVIEELMIAANEAVGENLARRIDPDAGPPALYRVHPAPRPDDIEPLARLAVALGVDPPRLEPGGSLEAGELARMLRSARERGGAGVLEQLTLRAMSRAVYAPSCDGHFALAAPYYCHFTSPIRRYPDLVDHRRMTELLGAAPALARDTAVESPAELARRLSDRERVAEAAERALRRWKKVRYLEDRTGSEWSGTITGVESFGVFVMLGELGIDGLISVERLDDDFYEHDPDNLELVGRRRGRRLRLGDSIRVRVAAVDIARRRVDLALAEEATH